MSKKDEIISKIKNMSKQDKKNSAIAAVMVLLVFIGLNSIFHFTGGHGSYIDALIERNIEARGGADVWRKVSTLRLSGQMDLGKGLHVPYVIEQKRLGKMCLEFLFNKETATQCVSGNTGWKVLPFQGRNVPEPMTKDELKEIIGMTEIDGLLFDSDKHGYNITLAGKEQIDGRNAIKLEVELPGGALRWVYLDEETALEIKLEMKRIHRGKEQLVETYYTDWRKTDGLLIPRRQETVTKGSSKPNFITVDSVNVNPVIDDSRFNMPVKATAKIKSSLKG
jgi:hypothetical protein